MAYVNPELAEEERQKGNEFFKEGKTDAWELSWKGHTEVASKFNAVFTKLYTSHFRGISRGNETLHRGYKTKS